MRAFGTILFMIPLFVYGQLTWADGAAELFYNNCTACHNDNGIAPFSLMNHDQVLNYSGSIYDAIESEYMPPWTADDSYSGLAHSRALEPSEKEALLSWLDDGAASGDLALVPPAPVYTNEGFIQETPDLVTEMEPHESNATAFLDDYICVSIPTGLTEDKVIRGFEVIPGNPSILHHCLVYIDESGSSESDFSGFCAGPNDEEGLIGGYAPGAFPTVFPSDGEDMNMGITLPAGSNIILALHYPHGSAGEVDQTKVNFYFYEEEVQVREMTTFPVLQNWDFFIEANTQQEVMAQFGPIQNDISIFSVFPHMHLIGEYIQSYAVTPENETIPLVKIPHWDFEWQEFYFFEQLQKIPQGSVMYSNGTYNNTSDNPHNPNSPPEDIEPGLNTSDEMFLVYFHYMPYLEGDENLDIENMISLSMKELALDSESSFDVYPNPSSNEFTIDLNLMHNSLVSLYIYDLSGQLIEKVVDKRTLSSSQDHVIWSSKNVDNGTYFYSALVDGRSFSGRLVVRK